MTCRDPGVILVLFYCSIWTWCEVEAYYNDVLNPVQVNIDVWHQRNPRVAIRNNQDLGCERPNLYVCEEPIDVVSPEATKTCNYRNQSYHEQVYRWVAGRGCLLYTPDFLYVGGSNTINLNTGCFYGELYAPCLEIPKEDGTCGCYPFDPGLEEVAVAVRAALIPSAHGRWERCFYAAADCCSHYMIGNDNSSLTDSTTCGGTFDGWTCWRATEAGTVANEICSEFAYSGVGPSCHHFSNKECYLNGTWEIQTDYSTCSITPRLLRRYRFYIIILSFSIASCLPAVFVFFFYKRLRITRVALHRNLLIAIIIRNVLVIISRSEIYIDELTNSGDTVMATHSIVCRVLAVLERAAGNTVFVCMLVEGIYLHRLIVAVFRKKVKVKWLYGITGVLGILPVVGWASVMAVFDDHSCWLVYTVEHIQWILDGPRVLILLINTGLFIDVLRVLLTKLRNSENSNQLNTAKATIFLMPIFGVQFILTAIRPNTTNCTGEQIYYYISYTVEGFQGFIVAMLYCYFNKEVHTLVKATYKKTENAVVSRVHRDSTYPRMSLGPNVDKRITYSTGVPSGHEDYKESHATVPPKLHVAEIISIQVSERLAEILDPEYESIDTGMINETYKIDKSDVDSYTSIQQRRVEDYSGFTNASSVTIDCPDWIRCESSPNSSIYDEYENSTPSQNVASDEENEAKNKANNHDKRDPNIKAAQTVELHDSEYEDCETMLEEIIQYMESNEPNNPIEGVVLDPKLLCPYNKDNEQITFVD